jgi:transcriptional regulator with XRE-family HTH domain
MNLSHIRSNIKKLRRAKGTTQREMALRLYMDERTYAKIERGVNKSMDIRLLSAIADILDTDVASLLIDSHTNTETISQEVVETTASEKAFLPSDTPNLEHAKLLQEIMALKAEVRELIAVQKRAMKLLKL